MRRSSGLLPEDGEDQIDDEDGEKERNGGRRQPIGQPLTAGGHVDSESSGLRLRGEWNGPRPAECLREPCEHREVGVKLHAFQAANAEWRESVFVLQAAEGALNRAASAVEVDEPHALTRDQRVEAGRFAPHACWLALAGRAAPLRLAAMPPRLRRLGDSSDAPPAVLLGAAMAPA